MKSFKGEKTSITPGAVRNTEVMFGDISKGALNVLLSSQSNRQPVKIAGAVPLQDPRIIGCPRSFNSYAIELATLPVPPRRRMVGLGDIVVSWGLEFNKITHVALTGSIRNGTVL